MPSNAPATPVSGGTSPTNLKGATVIQNVYDEPLGYGEYAQYEKPTVDQEPTAHQEPIASAKIPDEAVIGGTMSYKREYL